MQLVIPPLRERGEDIIALAEFFITSKGSGKNLVLTEEARKYLMKLPFPGNFRELQSLIERTVLLTHRNIITPEDIQNNLSGIYSHEQFLQNYQEMPQSEKPPVQVNPKLQVNHRKKLTKDDIIEALAQCQYNREDAARKLGISRATLYRKMKEWS